MELAVPQIVRLYSVGDTAGAPTAWRDGLASAGQVADLLGGVCHLPPDVGQQLSLPLR